MKLCGVNNAFLLTHARRHPNSQSINASMISLFTLRNFILPKLLDHIKVIILRILFYIRLIVYMRK
jgi:hypothetical protein